MQDEIRAFLGIWAPPTEAEVKLWAAILDPISEGITETLIDWAQRSTAKPTPRDLLDLHARRPAIGPMARVAAVIAAKEGVTLADIRSRTSNREISRARQRVMFELRALGHSLAEIGRYLGRDHTTVKYGADNWAALLTHSEQPTAQPA